jgi:hypothetical protein
MRLKQCLNRLLREDVAAYFIVCLLPMLSEAHCVQPVIMKIGF